MTPTEGIVHGLVRDGLILDRDDAVWRREASGAIVSKYFPRPFW